MSSNIRWILGLFLLGLVLPLSYYYIISENPDVRYSISQGIPASFITNQKNNASNCIQEINVKNYGNKKSEKVILKVNSEVIEYDILKNSKHDTVKEEKEKDLFEIQYVELVPDGQFSIILKTLKPIVSKSINVFDSTGQCEEIKRLSIVDLVGSAFVVVWTTFFLTLFISSLLYVKDSWKSDLKYIDLNKLFYKRKPFWVEKSDWQKEIISSFSSKLKKDWLMSEPKDAVSYKVLDFKADNIKFDDNTYKEILSMASKRFKGFMLEPKIFYSIKQLNEQISLPKPRNLDKQKWDEIQQGLQKKYLGFLKENSLNYYSIEKCEDEYLRIDTYPINNDVRKEYEDFVKKYYIQMLLNSNFIYRNECFDLLRKTRYKDILDEKEQENIEKAALGFLKENSLNYYSIEKCEDEYLRIDTYPINNDVRKEYEDFVKKYYIQMLLNSNFIYRNECFDLLRKTRYKDILDEKEQENIEKAAFDIQLSAFEGHHLLYPSTDKYEEEIERISLLSESVKFQDEYEIFLRRNYIRELLNTNILNEQSILKSLEKTKYKTILNNEEQKKLESIAYKIQIASLEKELEFSTKCQKSLQNNEYTWISSDDIERLKKKVYNKELEKEKLKTDTELKASIEKGELDWLEQKDKEQLVNESEMKKKYIKFNILFDIINKVLSGQFIIDDKPDGLDDNDWNTILALHNRMLCLNNK